jgi:biopolymer transport protein ExbD
MARNKKLAEEQGLNMTPMIDVVFQLIIFFITTADMENKALDTKIRMAMAPFGPAVEKKDPRTITVDVDTSGHISIGNVRISDERLSSILKKAVGDFGNSIPLVIRGDSLARHIDIRRVMDICTEAGLYRISFSAIKEKAQRPS